MVDNKNDFTQGSIVQKRICGGGIFFIIAYNVISSISRGIGDSSMPLVFVGIACVVNIVGDLFATVFSSDTAVIARAAEYLKGFAPDALTEYLCELRMDYHVIEKQFML